MLSSLNTFRHLSCWTTGRCVIKAASILGLLWLCVACGRKTEQGGAMGAAFEKQPHSLATDYDLEDIRKGGELIVTTLSGPDTYYEYRGVGLGFQYALAENFAATEGLKLRVEIASDTASLFRLLKSGEADIIAFPISQRAIHEEGLLPVVLSTKEKNGWAVRETAKELAAALEGWLEGGVEVNVRKLMSERLKKSKQVRRRAKAVYLSRSRGIISIYDDLFKQASQTTGWDWRLIAAQCYQESAFDPNAKSWAGAQGLMQLMPGTAKELGVAPEEVNFPDRNVAAAARYIRKLNGVFSDIRDGGERTKFVLAAYNGGASHIRDAMALARKYGRDPHAWGDVSTFVLGLQQPRYYRDPVVKEGYMIGSETVAYVQSVLERWQGYGGHVSIHKRGLPIPDSPSASSTMSEKHDRSVRKNKYSSGVRIMLPDDPEFHRMGNVPKTPAEPPR